MSDRTTSAVPLYRNPSLWPGLAALSSWLEDQQYSQHARERIVDHTAGHGTPTGSPELVLEDEGGATDAFIAALPAVPYAAAAWGEPDRADGFDQPLATFEREHPVRSPQGRTLHRRPRRTPDGRGTLNCPPG
jgi:hypothetical protein